MFNNYTIDVYRDNKQVKAQLYVNKIPLGTVWTPTKDLCGKEDFQGLFNLIGSVIYGQEQKTKKEKEPDCEGTPILTAAYHAEQENIGS